MIKIDIYSDTICPWCYIGKRKLKEAIDFFPKIDFDIIWRPYQLNPNMPVKGIDRKKYLSQKFGSLENAKKIYEIINYSGKKTGIFFQFDKITKTPNSFASHKLLAMAYKKGLQDQIIESLFYSYFIEGKDIGKIEELITIGKQYDLDENQMNEYLTSNEDREELLKEEFQAKTMGIKGLPSFIINKEYVLFGAQEKSIFVELFNKLIK